MNRRPPQHIDEFEMRAQIEASESRIAGLTQQMEALRKAHPVVAQYADLLVKLDVEKENIQHCKRQIEMKPMY